MLKFTRCTIMMYTSRIKYAYRWPFISKDIEFNVKTPKLRFLCNSILNIERYYNICCFVV